MHFLSCTVGDFGKEDITNTDKPLQKDKDSILKDKPVVTDTLEDRKHASKRSGGAICILCILSIIS